MKTMFDTSVLVPALVKTNQNHATAVPWLERAHSGEFPWFIGAHSLAECYATLTAMAKPFALDPAIVAQSIRKSLMPASARIIELTADEYIRSIDSVAALGLRSGIIFDAILITAARKAGIERLVTYNLRHFNLAWPDNAGIIVAPL